MDAAGKDGTIKHVMSGVNPQGCQVYSFKAPSAEELDHDFLWRTDALPARARPHRHLQSLVLRRDARRARAPGAPRAAAPARPAGHEAHLEGALRGHQQLRALPRRATASSSGSSSCTCRRKEQKQRFLERLDQPEKNWKFSAGRRAASGSTGTTTWTAYEDMIRHTATPHAPWYVVPADNKWFTRLVVAAADRRTAAGTEARVPGRRSARSDVSWPRRARRWSRKATGKASEKRSRPAQSEA